MSYAPPESLLRTTLGPEGDGFLRIADFLAEGEASDLFDHCRNTIQWCPEYVSMFGVSHVAPRLTSCFGDPGATYRYRGSAQHPLPWSEPLRTLRARLEDRLQSSFNFALLNLYRDGSDHVGYHSDDERDLMPEPVIASLSLGSTRVFRIRELGTGHIWNFKASHGALILMWGDSQRRYKHSLVKTARPVGERINLSFRRVNA